MAKDKVSLTDHPRKQHSILALSLAGAEWTGNPDKQLMECIAAIGTYGTSAKLIEQFKSVQAAAIVNRDLPMDDEDRKRFAVTLNELGGYIRRLIAGIVKLEEKVDALGCRVNPETGKVSLRRDGKGRDVVRKRIWEIYAKDYRKEYQGAATRRQFAIRKAIAKQLSTHIDESELDPSAKAGALIYDTIKKGEKRQK